MSLDLVTVIQNFDEDNLIARLYRISQLGVDALANQNCFNHSEMCQMRPTDTCEWVK